MTACAKIFVMVDTDRRKEERAGHVARLIPHLTAHLPRRATELLNREQMSMRNLSEQKNIKLNRTEIT